MTASQQAMVMDIIEGVKRKRKATELNYAQAGTKLTRSLTSNRGNKLVPGAEFIQQGRLWNPHSLAHRSQISYNGYQRKIIAFRPPRFDDEDDLLETEHIQEDNSSLPAGGYVYEGIKMEELFRPLVAASDLPTHKAMSAPYLEVGLPEMVSNLETELHRQKETLWRLKSIWTTLRGDTNWAPVEDFHDHYDDCILGSSVLPGAAAVSNGKDYGMMTNGSAASVDTTMEQADANKLREGVSMEHGGLDAGQAVPNGQDREVEQIAETGTDSILAAEGSSAVQAQGPSTSNDDVQSQRKLSDDSQSMDIVQSLDPGSAGTPQPRPSKQEDVDMDSQAEASTLEDGTVSQVQSHRMTTRAQASRDSRSQSPTRPESGQTASVAIHPMFQYPISAIPDASNGLPPQLSEESRGLLLQYVSRQEEVVRQQTKLLDKMRKALAMRSNVYRWCKAEGHIGEMSDGEDWYDKDEWGLDVDLIKGKDEEEEDDRAGKPRRRARAEKPN